MKTFKQYFEEENGLLTGTTKEVWRDSKGQLVYIKDVPVKHRGGLTRWQWEEGKDMTKGSIGPLPDGTIFYPPFTMNHENI